MAYEIEQLFEIWDNADGTRVEVGLDRDGLGQRECRHCGWLCMPNDAPAKTFYPLEPQSAQQQAEQESVIKRQAQKIGELIAERDSWIEAHARLYRLYHDQSPKAGEEIHVNVEGGDVYTLPLQLSGMDKPRFVVHVPCSPQAEPGADERAARLVEDAAQRLENSGFTAHAEAVRAAQSGQRAGVALLADEHKGMRVDYQGLFKQARAGLRREPFLAEMLRQFQDHVTELGRRWYAGDTAVVDELLQLYCVEREARAAIAVTSANLEGQSNG